MFRGSPLQGNFSFTKSHVLTGRARRGVYSQTYPTESRHTALQAQGRDPIAEFRSRFGYFTAGQIAD
jgi:hypothetical protein